MINGAPFIEILLNHTDSIFSGTNEYTHLNKSRERIKEVVYVRMNERLHNDSRSIDDFIELLKSYKEQGGTHISFESQYDSDSAEMDVKFFKWETDEEYKQRMAKVDEYEKRKAEIQDEMEREEYGRLKLKYESKY